MCLEGYDQQEKTNFVTKMGECAFVIKGHSTENKDSICSQTNKTAGLIKGLLNILRNQEGKNREETRKISLTLFPLEKGLH